MKVVYNIGNCTTQEAYNRINNFLGSISVMYSNDLSNSTKTWNDKKDRMDFNLEAEGFDMTGDIKLTEGKLVLNCNLPSLVKSSSGKVEEIIKEQLDGIFPKLS